MTTITQQDREAAALLLGFKDWDDATDYRNSGRTLDGVSRTAQAFAAHRLRTIEECAKIADRHDTGDCTREDMEARRIAADIRKLGEA